DARLGSLANYLTVGGSVDHSAIGFRSNSTLGTIYPDFRVGTNAAQAGSGAIIHTMGNLGYAPADLAGMTDYFGLYAVDGLDVTKGFTITAGFRLNVA